MPVAPKFCALFQASPLVALTSSNPPPVGMSFRSSMFSSVPAKPPVAKNTSVSSSLSKSAATTDHIRNPGMFAAQSPAASSNVWSTSWR